MNYSNVAATIALIVAIGTGGAYAAGELGSGDIRDNSLRSVDLKNGRGVKGQDVARNSLTDKQVSERSLDASQFAPLAGDQAVDCDPDGPVHIECAGAGVRLQSAGRLLVIASGDFFGDGTSASLDCRIAVDDINRGVGAAPGETLDPSTSGTATDGFAVTFVTRRLPPGRHDLALRCSEVDADGALKTSSIAVLGISK